MKKLNLLIGLLIGFTIFSCSSNDDRHSDNPQNTLKPLKYTIIESDGDNWTLNFEYNGNKISKITSDYGNTLTFRYNNENLSQYTIHYSNEPSDTYQAIYENDKLVELNNSDDSESILFYYNSSGQINQSIWNENGFSETTYYEYDSVGNVNKTNDEYSEVKYIYDNKNNPFKNVIPQLDAEIAWPWFGNLINNQIEVQRKNFGETEFHTQYTYEYDYNTSNYPTERRQYSPSGILRETVTYEY